MSNGPSQDPDGDGLPDPDDGMSVFGPWGELEDTLPAARERAELMDGFAPGGRWVKTPPGPELAAALVRAAGPGWRCGLATGEQLVGLLRSMAAMQSWWAAGMLGVARALIRDNDLPFLGIPKHGDLPDEWDDSLIHEVALALGYSVPAAAKALRAAWELGARLPAIAALLQDGTLDLARAKLIAEVFQDLSDENAAKAEALILPELTTPPRKTWGQVERLATRIAAMVDPGYAERRRRNAVKYHARVRMFREQSGAAALSGRDLAVDQTLAADAAIDARAQAYQDCGAFDGERLDQLRATAFLDILNGISAEDRIAYGRLSDDSTPDSPDRGTGVQNLTDRLRRHPDEPGADEPGRDEPGGDAPDGGKPDGGAPHGGEPHGDESGGDEPHGGEPDGGEPAGAGPTEHLPVDGPCGRQPDDQPDDQRAGDPSHTRLDDDPGHRQDTDSSTPPAPVSPSSNQAQPKLTDLVLPLATLLGQADRPGEGHSLGTLDPALCRALAITAARSPHTTICITVTNPDGIAVGHGCAKLIRRPSQPPGQPSSEPPGQPPGPPRQAAPPLAALPARINLTIAAARLTEPRAQPQTTTPGPAATGWAFTRAVTPAGRNARASTGPPGDPDWRGTWTLTMPGERQYSLRLEPVPTFDCDHRHESHGYQPNDTLRHLVQIRDYTCTFPSCNRHAREADFEHALPYDRGGRTCACNAGARSRQCHRVKQSSGWTVTQPQPGWHQWTTPRGWTYTQGPGRYPV